MAVLLLSVVVVGQSQSLSKSVLTIWPVSASTSTSVEVPLSCRMVTSYCRPDRKSRSWSTSKTWPGANWTAIATASSMLTPSAVSTGAGAGAGAGASAGALAGGLAGASTGTSAGPAVGAAGRSDAPDEVVGNPLVSTR